jgi:hypothetical protein
METSTIQFRRFCLSFVLTAFALSGCAGLRIPAPDAPVAILAEPIVDASRISVPVKISVDGILSDLGFVGSRDRIAGGIRRFLKRQALKNETRLVQTRFVRQQLEQVWSEIQRPIPLQNGLFLLLNPRALSVSTLPDEEDAITLILGLTARPKIVAGPSTAVVQPLPEISIAPAPTETGFHIALETELTFEQLGNELTARLKGTTYAGKDGSVVVEKVKVYGSGTSLVAAVDIKGTVEGTVYVYGVPGYDRSARTLVLKNPDYTLETMQVLSRSADWLLHAGLREKLAQRAVWYVGDRIDDARDDLSKALNRQVGDRLHVSGNIGRMFPHSVGLTKGGLKAVVEADGTINVQLLDLGK